MAYGYGACHPQPHGWKTVTTDVTAANIQTLTSVYQHIVVSEPGGVRVLFHFDYAEDVIAIQSERTTDTRMRIRQWREDVLWDIRFWVVSQVC
jgi:hypothetical protein